MYPNPLGSGKKKPQGVGNARKALIFRLPEHKLSTGIPHSYPHPTHKLRPRAGSAASKPPKSAHDCRDSWWGSGGSDDEQSPGRESRPPIQGASGAVGSAARTRATDRDRAGSITLTGPKWVSDSAIR